MKACRTFTKVLIIFLASTAFGCSSAGPFVTNVSVSGENTLLIEKCHLGFNGITSQITTENCASHLLKIR